MRSAIVLALVLAVVSYLLIDLQGNLEFALKLRAGKLAPMVIAGVALAASTVALQALTRNPLLTPSLLGVDAFYLMCVSFVVLWAGPTFLQSMSSASEFVLTVLLMTPISAVLLWVLLRLSQRDIQKLVMTGLVFTLFFRAMSQFAQRLISPEDFASVQIRSFGRFQLFDYSVPALAGLLAGLCVVIIWRKRKALDLMGIDPRIASAHGVSVDRTQRLVLLAICGLVVVATALVGPIVFLGLLAVCLARLLPISHGVETTLWFACALGVLVLVIGQILGEHLLSLAVPTTLIVEAVGGLVFVGLLMRQGKRWS